MKRKAFTLIEVLIVVIIIGILATLLLPQMGVMAERARVAEAKNMMGALRTVLTVTFQEEGDWPAFTDLASNALINGELGSVIDEDKSLFNYEITSDGETPVGAVITATRDDEKSFSSPQYAVVTMTIAGDGRVITDMDVTWEDV